MIQRNHVNCNKYCAKYSLLLVKASHLGIKNLWAIAFPADFRFSFYVLLCLCIWVCAIVGLWDCEFVDVC